MDTTLKSRTTSGKHSKSKTPSIVRGIISGMLCFVIFILLIPFVLSKTETPEKYIAVSAVMTVAFTSLAASFAANFGNKGFVVTGTVCALSIILILVILSLVFGNTSEDKNYIFSALLYSCVFVFSLLGAKLSSAKKAKKTKRRR